VIKFLKIWLAIALLCGAQAAMAQGTSIGLTGEVHDGSLPVEATADALSVDQETSTAVFEGNATVTQGTLHLDADKIRIEYKPEDGGVSRVEATGGVTFTNGTEIAEAESAVYTVGTSEISMTGGVLLLQGQNTISGDRLVLDLDAGTGTMQGNVKTVFTPANGK
jgi:lipopolysaccharide export system protein LptA